MGLTVFEYSRGINDLLKSFISREASTIVENFNEKKIYKENMVISLSDKDIKIKHNGTVDLFPDQFYNRLFETFRPFTYEVLVDYVYNDKGNQLKKSAPSDEDASRLVRSMLEIPNEKIKSVTLKTKPFDITTIKKKTEDEVVIRLRDTEKAKSIYRLLLNELFPYVKIGVSIRKVENIYSFDVRSITPKQVNLKVDIKIDGSSGGVKVNTFTIK
jgi:hypothetical protein